MPSESTLASESTARFVKIQGTQPSGPAKEIIENLSKSNFKSIKIFYEAVQKKNIFASTQFLETQTMTGTFEASGDMDTLYFFELSQGSGQWFYHSSKGGKQLFAYDRSVPTPTGKVQAFVDAVMTQAIRDWKLKHHLLVILVQQGSVLFGILRWVATADAVGITYSPLQ